MPKQAPLRIIKRWRRYQRRGDWRGIPPITRGLYILYNKEPSRRGGAKQAEYKVAYIGVAGVGKNPQSGIGGRLRSHDRGRKKWTHYSFLEVHDNVSREEIRELESLLLVIFRHDSRIHLANKQKGSGNLSKLRKKGAWSDVLLK